MSWRRVLLMGVVVWLVACSGASSRTSDETSPDLSTVVPLDGTMAAVIADREACAPNDNDGTVTVWHSMGGPAATDLWADLEVEFESTHSVKLDVVNFGGDRAILDELAATSRDEWPDLVDVSEQSIQTLFDTNQFLVPAVCNPLVGADLLPLIRKTYSVNDELLALPFAVSSPILIFDAAEFRTAGLDPTAPPLTLDGLLSASKALADTGASPYGLVLTDSCANLVLDQFSAKREVPVGGGENGHDLNPVTFDFATAENAADLAALAEGVVTGHVKYLGGSENNLNDLVELSNTTEAGGAMTIHTSGALGDVIRLLGNYPGVELGVGPLPGPGVGALIGGNAMWLPMNTDPEQVGRAWSVLEWLYEPQRLSRLAIEAGFVPPTESAAKDPALLARWGEYPQLRVAYQQVVNTRVTAASAGVLVGPFSGKAGIFYETCDKIIKRGADVTATLQWATNAVNEVLQDYAAQRNGEPSTSPSDSVDAVSPPSATEISGTVECVSGAEVVGVYVVGETLPDVNQGFATYDDTKASKVGYRFVLPYGGRYQLHVGCGGSRSEWGSESFTVFVSESSDFLCRDDPPKRGSCETL